jgi:hypothetical protein
MARPAALAPAAPGPSTAGPSTAGPSHPGPPSAPRPGAAQPFSAAEDGPAPGSGADRSRDIAYARAQVARIAEAGLADTLSDEAQAGTGRVKTRLLGFQSQDLAAQDPFARAHDTDAAGEEPTRGPMFPVGWILVVAGPGRGASFALTRGVARIGRGPDNSVCLDFGDTAISRAAHASIAYDEEARRFFLGAGARSNLVRRNDRPVLATEEIADGDLIRLGKTTLRFVALCGPDFDWAGPADGAAEAPE